MMNNVEEVIDLLKPEVKDDSVETETEELTNETGSDAEVEEGDSAEAKTDDAEVEEGEKEPEAKDKFAEKLKNIVKQEEKLFKAKQDLREKENLLKEKEANINKFQEVFEAGKQNPLQFALDAFGVDMETALKLYQDGPQELSPQEKRQLSLEEKLAKLENERKLELEQKEAEKLARQKEAEEAQSKNKQLQMQALKKNVYEFISNEAQKENFKLILAHTDTEAGEKEISNMFDNLYSQVESHISEAEGAKRDLNATEVVKITHRIEELLSARYQEQVQRMRKAGFLDLNNPNLEQNKETIEQKSNGRIKLPAPKPKELTDEDLEKKYKGVRFEF